MQAAPRVVEERVRAELRRYLREKIERLPLTVQVEIAMAQLYRRIKEQQDAALAGEIASARKSLVGSGDRSEKIRTYNYPQNRVTDHRINLTLHSLDKIMAGGLDPVIEGLQVAENADKLKEGV